MSLIFSTKALFFVSCVWGEKPGVPPSSCFVAGGLLTVVLPARPWLAHRDETRLLWHLSHLSDLMAPSLNPVPHRRATCPDSDGAGFLSNQAPFPSGLLAGLGWAGQPACEHQALQ